MKKYRKSFFFQCNFNFTKKSCVALWLCFCVITRMTFRMSSWLIQSTSMSLTEILFLHPFIICKKKKVKRMLYLRKLSILLINVKYFERRCCCFINRRLLISVFVNFLELHFQNALSKAAEVSKTCSNFAVVVFSFSFWQ